MPKIEFKILIQELKKVGLKVTPARLTILHTLKVNPQPQTIADIKKQLGVAQIDLVTVYRNVEAMVKLGMVKKVLLDDDEAFYEYAAGLHHHLVCKNCGRIEDFEGCNAKNLIKQALDKSKEFRQVSEHSLELFGLCNTCARVDIGHVN